MTRYMHLQIYHLMLGHYHHGLPFSDVNFLTSDVRGHPYTASGDFSDFSSVRPQNRAIKTEIESTLSFLANLSCTGILRGMHFIAHLLCVVKFSIEYLTSKCFKSSFHTANFHFLRNFRLRK